MQCMKIIAFDSFNNARMDLIIKEFLSQSEPNEPFNSHSTEKNTTVAVEMSAVLSSPSDIAKKEPLFFVGTRQGKIHPLPIHFGVSLEEFARRTGKKVSELEGLLRQASGKDKYLLAAEVRPRHKPSVVVSFLSHASPKDQAKAYYHAILLSRQLKECNAVNVHDVLSAEAIANEQLESTWNSFSQACRESGWDLSKTELQSHGYELELIEKR